MRNVGHVQVLICIIIKLPKRFCMLLVMECKIKMSVKIFKGSLISQ